MNLIIVSGFLGSGKTTFIIKLAEAAVQKGLKIAILVNEIGEIGIDDQFMRQLDLNVRELLGGCICCTMAGNVIETLGILEKNYAPDLVITEPTGAADPQNLLRGLELYEGKSLLNLYQIAILDPLRLDMLMEVLTPLTTSTLKTADLICISKRDAATEKEMAYAFEVAEEIRPEVKTVAVSLKENPDISLFEEILRCAHSR